MSEQNKFLLLLVSCFAFFFGFEYFFPTKTMAPSHISDIKTVSNFDHIRQESNQIVSIDEALKLDNRLLIDTPALEGSINLKGCLFDDLKFKKYTLTPDSKELVRLYTPVRSKDAYFSEVNYADSSAPQLGQFYETPWKVVSDNKVLRADTPVVLESKINSKVSCKRTISVDDQYLFTIEDEIMNTSFDAVNIEFTNSVYRHGKPQTSGFFVLHEGGVGYVNNKLVEVSYDDIEKKKNISCSPGKGWIGFTDKYWLSAFIPNSDVALQSGYDYQDKDHTFRSYSKSAPITVASKSTHVIKHHLFSGAKILKMLDGYEESHKFKHFDLAVDFGWFYFLTKPLFYVLDNLNAILGNMGFAILILTVFFKILSFPLANKSHRSMARMKQLQPKMDKLKEQYGSDHQKYSMELMALYKKEKVNPASGCLPTLIQAPLFFCLYKVFFVTIEMRHAPFLGWIQDLSAPDPTSFINLFGLLPFDAPTWLIIGAWPLIMGVTMIIQQRMGPQSTDPTQAKMMMVLPIVFTYMFASFPSGLVIYWAWSNVLTILQQYYISQQKPVEKVARKSVGTNRQQRIEKKIKDHNDE